MPDTIKRLSLWYKAKSGRSSVLRSRPHIVSKRNEIRKVL